MVSVRRIAHAQQLRLLGAFRFRQLLQRLYLLLVQAREGVTWN
ncbi:hypothetical protein [Hymenobacter psychrophilus]|nr:hypothetical protein [Hymenobacter psychrophilus]